MAPRLKRLRKPLGDDRDRQRDRGAGRLDHVVGHYGDVHRAADEVRRQRVHAEAGSAVGIGIQVSRQVGRRIQEVVVQVQRLREQATVRERNAQVADVGVRLVREGEQRAVELVGVALAEVERQVDRASIGRRNLVGVGVDVGVKLELKQAADARVAGRRTVVRAADQELGVAVAVGVADDFDFGAEALAEAGELARARAAKR